MYFEDFQVGDTYVTEPVEMTESEIVDFANRFDPQPFHLDREAAERSIYGGLIASGWHVMSVTFGAMVKVGIFAGGGQGAPGLEQVRWMKPVRPGDCIRMVMTVDDIRRSQTHRDRGYVLMRFEIMNQADQMVSSYQVREIFKRRPDTPR